MKPQTLCIIPARGGSKSIPKKNIVDLGGKPLISYVIEAAKKSGIVDRIVCTTDDEGIAKVARQYGAETPFLRPAELAQDDTPSLPVIEHALVWLEENEGNKPEYVLLLQPTDPFVMPRQIKDVFDLMLKKGADSGITMEAVPRTHHPYHVRHVTDDGYVEFIDQENHYTHPNRQSDPKRYGFANLYWFRRDAFLREKKIEVGKRVGVEIDPVTAHDINESFDLEIARILVKKLQSRTS